MAATFQNVYTADGLQVPWFVTGGPPDWEGNITGACPGSQAEWGVCVPLSLAPLAAPTHTARRPSADPPPGSPPALSGDGVQRHGGHGRAVGVPQPVVRAGCCFGG